MARKPITEKITGLRQRQRADGTWRVWWEPPAQARARGATPCELDADRATWSARQARKLTTELSADPATRRKPNGARTMTALIAAYSADQLLEKAPATQTGYRGLLKLIDTKWGDELVSDLTKAVMYQWGKTLSRQRGATQAKRMMAMCSTLFSYGELLGWRPENSNPCFRLKLPAPEKRTRIATLHEIEALERAAIAMGATAIHHALILGLFTGQRQTDILNASLGDFQIRTIPATAIAPQHTAPVWRITRSKRRTSGFLPLHPEAAEVLAKRKTETADQTAPLLHINGAPITTDQFQRAWIAVRTAAATDAPTLTGDDPLWFRDLRRTAGVWARQGGATRQDVGDLLGNTAGHDDTLAAIYMPASFETSGRAIAAINRPGSTERKKA